jgi:hypothetical protein
MSVVWISHNPSAICVHISISKALDVLFVWLRVPQCAKQKNTFTLCSFCSCPFWLQRVETFTECSEQLLELLEVHRVRSFGPEVACIVHSYGFWWEENFVGSLVKLKPWMLMEKNCIEWWPFAIEMYIGFSNQVVSNPWPVSEYLCSCDIKIFLHSICVCCDSNRKWAKASHTSWAKAYCDRK